MTAAAKGSWLGRVLCSNVINMSLNELKLLLQGAISDVVSRTQPGCRSGPHNSQLLA